MLQLLVKPIPVVSCLNCASSEQHELPEGQTAFACPACGAVLMERLADDA